MHECEPEDELVIAHCSLCGDSWVGKVDSKRTSIDGIMEVPLTFDCLGDTLIGILHKGASDASTGVLMVVGGRQYRAGAHRQFVKLARYLACHGIPVLRFDVRGMGDSEGDVRHFLALE